MSEQATKIILDPPTADLVLVVSASWFVWAGIAIVLLLGVLAFMPKKPKE